MNDEEYNRWRAEISALYVFLTGRAYPNINTKRRELMIRRLVYLSDFHPECTPFDALDVLVTEGILAA